MQVPYRKPGKYAMQGQDPFLSAEKLVVLEKKLERLKRNRGPAAAEVSRLAELGDFSENVEYQLAKGRLRGINDGILRLENQIKNAVVIEPQKQKGVVGLGSRVRVLVGGKEKEYQILGSAEVDLQKGIVSHNSPIGQALLGKKVGDELDLELKDRIVVYKILEVK